MPPVFPHGLVKLCQAKFIYNFRSQRNHLYHSIPFPEHIDILGDQHKQLLTAYHVEPTTQTLIESCDGNTSVAKAWSLLVVLFPYLVNFCGGFTTVLSGTSTVKSDFSTLRSQKFPFCKCQSKFALKGVCSIPCIFQLLEVAPQQSMIALWALE